VSSSEEGTHRNQMQAFVILLRMSETFAAFPGSYCLGEQYQKVLSGASLITPLPCAILPADVILLAGFL